MGKKLIVILSISVLAIIGVAAFVLLRQEEPESAPIEPVVEEDGLLPRQQVIGTSVEGRDIKAYTYGQGNDTHLLFVGGIHGGYEWNTVLLAYLFLDHFEANPEIIPDTVQVTIIPSANPDGVYEVIGKEGRFESTDAPPVEATVPGRFNANGVDLNRNFDCKWQPESTWRGNIVSAGSSPFSEPEAAAIRDFVLETHPDAVVFWHSQANTVYPADCEDGFPVHNLEIMEAYANAANYNTQEVFDAYEVTGAAEGWVSSLGIPALTVELQTHETIEWERNLAGVEALLEYYGEE